MMGTSPYDAPRGGWTDERIEELKRRWAAGESATKICRDMRCTSRSAVLGKLKRLGLCRGRKDKERPVAAGAAETKRDTAQSVSPGRSHAKNPDTEKKIKLRPVPAVAPAARPLRCVPVDGSGVSLVELHDGMCRWPISADGKPFRFCGGPAPDGKPYCQNHHRLSLARPVTAAQIAHGQKIGRQNAIRWRNGRGVTQHKPGAA